MGIVEKLASMEAAKLAFTGMGTGALAGAASAAPGKSKFDEGAKGVAKNVGGQYGGYVAGTLGSYALGSSSVARRFKPVRELLGNRQLYGKAHSMGLSRASRVGARVGGGLANAHTVADGLKERKAQREEQKAK